MDCPNPLELQSYFDRELCQKKAHRIASHLLTCRECQEKMARWTELTQLLHEAYPELRPLESSCRRGKFNEWKPLAAAVAMVVMVGGLSIAWHFKVFTPFEERRQASRATELLEQYFILYQEATESDGGSDV